MPERNRGDRRSSVVCRRGNHDRAAQACGARTAVTFELLAGGASGEAAGADRASAEVDQQSIVAKPTLPPDPTIPVVVSPDRLPGT